MEKRKKTIGRQVIAKSAWASVFPLAGATLDPLDKSKTLGFSGLEVLSDYSLVTGASKKNAKGKKRRNDFAQSETEDIVTSDENVPVVKKAKKTQKLEKVAKRKAKTKTVVAKPGKDRASVKPKSKKSYDKMNMPSSDTVTESEVDMSAWKGLGVPDEVLRVLSEQKFTQPTKIQKLSLAPAIFERKDILGAAETGSGKTLAFGIPIIHHILKDKAEENNPGKDTVDEKGADDGSEESDFDDESYDEDKIGCVKVVNGAKFPFEADPGSNARRKGPLRALILAPTRELAIQVKNHLMFAAKYTDIKIAVVLGGMAVEKQLRMLKACPDIVVATPGRLWELIDEGEPHLAKAPRAKYLVIDEADRMLERGHFEELERLLHLINENEDKCDNRQTFVFSATLTLVHDAPRRAKPRVNKYTMTEKQKLEELIEVIGLRENPKVVDVTQKTRTAEGLIESRIHCAINEKDYYLYYFLVQHPGRTLVFCNSIDCIRRLENIFRLLKQKMWTLHASMQQKQRLKNLEKFSGNDVGILLATDVAARGLDIPNIHHVIHYQVPRTSESYVHRSGRTARASREGLSVMLIEPNEMSGYKNLCWTLKKDFNQLLFPVDLKFMPQVKARVNMAIHLDKLLHNHRTFEAKSSWFQQTAKECDMEIDEDEFVKDYGDDRQKSLQKKEMKFLEKQLETLLKQPLLPIGVSAKKLTVPDMLGMTIKEADSALELVKKDAKVQREMLDRFATAKVAPKKVRLGKKNKKKKKYGRKKGN